MEVRTSLPFSSTSISASKFALYQLQLALQPFNSSLFAFRTLCQTMILNHHHDQLFTRSYLQFTSQSMIKPEGKNPCPPFPRFPANAPRHTTRSTASTLNKPVCAMIAT